MINSCLKRLVLSFLCSKQLNMFIGSWHPTSLVLHCISSCECVFVNNITLRTTWYFVFCECIACVCLHVCCVKRRTCFRLLWLRVFWYFQQKSMKKTEQFLPWGLETKDLSCISLLELPHLFFFNLMIEFPQLLMFSIL